MTKRQETLLKELLEAYVGQAEPVSSAVLAKRMAVSSATVRNELAALEEEGFVHQPHTSAGRIPTLKAYEQYVQTCLQPKAPSASIQQRMVAAKKQADAEKAVARVLADITGVAVFVAKNKNTFFYTGLSQLFAQPEFMDQRYVISLSAVLDVLDTVMPKLFDVAQREASVLLGDQNPFGATSTVFLTHMNWEEDEDGLCALLTPLRTDYNRHLGLLNSLKS